MSHPGTVSAATRRRGRADGGGGGGRLSASLARLVWEPCRCETEVPCAFGLKNNNRKRPARPSGRLPQPKATARGGPEPADRYLRVVLEADGPRSRRLHPNLSLSLSGRPSDWVGPTLAASF